MSDDDYYYSKMASDRAKVKVSEEKNKITERKHKEDTWAKDRHHDESMNQKELDRASREEEGRKKIKNAQYQVNVRAKLDREKIYSQKETALQVQQEKSNTDIRKENIKQQSLNTMSHVQGLHEKDMRYIDSELGFEHKDYDFEHDIVNKHVDSKIRQTELEKQSSREFSQTQKLNKDKFDKDRFFALKDIENQQTQQANQLNYNLLSQEKSEAQELKLLKEKELENRQNYSHQEKENRLTHSYQAEQERHTHRENTLADLNADIIRSREADKSYLVKSDEDLRTQTAIIISKTENEIRKEQALTKELRKRSEQEIRQESARNCGEMMRDFNKGEIQKNIDWNQAEIRVWEAGKLGRDVTDEEVKDIVRESSADWDKEI